MPMYGKLKFGIGDGTEDLFPMSLLV